MPVKPSYVKFNTQTAVTNMTIKRILENKFINLTFRMFQHTSSEVLVTALNDKVSSEKLYLY